MSRLVLGPFNRVEGDLELQLDVEGGQVSAARVNSPLFRGFEQILVGRAPLDALAIVPRICGICSVAQSAAAALALADAAGIVPAPNGRLARHLIQATENLADHLTHFYLFFMPDFARSEYAHHAWHGAVSARFAALITQDGATGASARTIDPAPPDSAMVIRFVTNPKSRKVRELARDPRVTLYYFDAKGMRYATVHGVAREVRDAARKAAA